MVEAYGRLDDLVNALRRMAEGESAGRK